MGERIASHGFTGDDRVRFRDRVQSCVDVIATMLATRRFDFDRPMTGTEIELSLIDDEGLPVFANDTVLDRIGDAAFTEELGRFNLEINVRPRTLLGDSAADLEGSLRAQLNIAHRHAKEVGAGLIMVGMLPTVRLEQLDRSAISANPRYAALDDQILGMRGEALHIEIDGVDRLELWSDTIAPEAVCTSLQFHLQVDPDRFADHWNAAQVLAGVQVATGANSPFFGGHHLWAETRIPLFTQATDTRPRELAAQGVRPRVWFGERYITSVFDLFEENITYFPAVLPVVSDEDPRAVLEAGGTPHLHELRLLNGTVWRWNRPVYEVVGDVPHIRLENRVLPSGPSVIDVMANAAFYYGALLALVAKERPPWTQLAFSTAYENFQQGARRGLEAMQYWPSVGDVPVAELVVRRLLPMAHDALIDWGVDTAVADRLLTVMERRCLTGRNGARWQVDTVRRYEDSGMDRWEALRRMTVDYAQHMHSNEPVHSWPLP